MEKSIQLMKQHIADIEKFLNNFGSYEQAVKKDKGLIYHTYQKVLPKFKEQIKQMEKSKYICEKYMKKGA